MLNKIIEMFSSKSPTQKLIEHEAQFVAKNYHPLPVVLNRGEGCYLWDHEGKKYLDMMSAYSAVSLGHSHPRIVKALTDQAQKLAMCSRAYHTNTLGPFVEKLVTTAVKAKKCRDDANQIACPHARGTDEYKTWRATEAGQTWLTAQAKYIHHRRRLFDVLRGNDVVLLLIDKHAPRFEDRPGGYTRVVHIAKRRLGDAAQLAYLEFVGEPTRLAVESKK